MSTFASRGLSWWERLTLGWAVLLAALAIAAVGLRLYAVGLLVTAIWDVMDTAQQLSRGAHAVPIR